MKVTLNSQQNYRQRAGQPATHLQKLGSSISMIDSSENPEKTKGQIASSFKVLVDTCYQLSNNYKSFESAVKGINFPK
ncbi:MAG: hypothetical protein QNJ31_06020 [Candidatus Caenarcaniphilales bacterium]|nr:hypothetical protein [Candidatus Caenarcaniphilales bacterium]